MENLKYWLWLSKININEKLKKDLILKYKNPRIIFELNKKRLEENNISNEDISEILKAENKKNLEIYEKYVKEKEIGALNIFSEQYPNKLLHIYDSPVVLFYRGNLELLKRQSIGIVGSRECSEYGMKSSKQLSLELSRNNICIISGLAKGIDSFAHIGAMRGPGKTIAVIGSGLDIVYPSQNENLENSIINNGGLILTEYIIGTKPKAINFPKRNRIISALSEGILVVEATNKSGALITVDFAIEQGKEVYAVPGNITNCNSSGTNELIKQGAKLVTNVKDILEDLNSLNIVL